MSQRIVLWLGLLLLLIAGLFAAATALVPGPQEPYTSRSASADGLKGLYELMKTRGAPVGRWDLGWKEFPSGKGQVLLMTEPGQFLVPEKNKKRLTRWIRKGNTLALFTSPGHPLAEEFGFSSRPGNGKEQVVAMESVSVPWLKEVRVLSFPENNRLEEGAGKGAWSDREGSPRMGRSNLGKGTIYYVPEPGFFTNDHIRKGDNLGLALHLASLAGDRLWFGDGFRKPIVSGGKKPDSLTELIAPEGWLLLLLGGAWFLIWLYSRGKRFAAPRWETAAETGRFDEYVQAMASLYQGAALGRDALLLQWKGLLREAARNLGLSVSSSPETIASQLSRFLGEESASRFTLLANRMDQLPKRVKGEELIRVSQEIQQIRKEISEWKSKPSIRKGLPNARKKSFGDFRR
ncbi:DUF4350 domain-containing protein [Salinithrix halophila]|uniref:DUF4350 domain-containing protein n=1 Tax=Salinithrix halophila TaxID=1485204 RepID=A0ABV8JJ40_9BACL